MASRAAASLALAFAAFIASTAGAIEAPPLAADPLLEARVLEVAGELRCLVCQNETIAASQSGLAVDLRKQIGQQLQEGRTQAQIRDYLVERYGDFVLYKPPFQATTAMLWLGPFALLAGALLFLLRMLRSRGVSALPPALNADERRRVRRLLDEEASGP